jgi:flavin reductase (DIM6/NTAB) family NADH-FMN oxidoreductase RutF
VSAAAAEQLFRALDRELWLVTSAHAGRRGGLIATSVMQASIAAQAPRVVVGIARQHATWELIEGSRVFSLHLLPPERLDLVERFGMHTGRDLDKFSGFDLLPQGGDAPRIAAAIGWLDCRVEAGWDSGDRTFYLAEVIAAEAPPVGASILTMQRLLADAPRHWLPTLRQQLLADAGRDLVAIEAWRATHLPPP